MIVNIPRNDTDDPVFLTALNGMLANLVASYRPSEVHFIRIGRWFDHKWLGYSGRGRVKFEEGWPWIDTALDPVWREKLTFPPFNPNRVLEQISFHRDESGYHRNPDARPIHKPERSHSSKNLQNRVVRFTQLGSGLFVWFSSDTAHLDHASVMSYAVKDYRVQSWFASFRKNDGAWKVHKVKGISEAAVQTWFPLGS